MIDGRDQPTHHILSVLVENKAGVLARVAGLFARRGLQHLLAGRRAHRRRAVQPHHHRGRRRVGAARADHQAARQADQRGEDHRARPGRRGRARAAARHGDGRARGAAARSSSWSASSRAGSWRRPRRADRVARRVTRRRWTTSRSCCGPTGSWSCSAPAGSRCPKLERDPRHRRHCPARPEREKARLPDKMANVYYEKDADRSLIAEPQGGDHRLRLAGPRPRPEPEGLGRRRACRPARGLGRRRPRPRRPGCAVLTHRRGRRPRPTSS